MNSPLKTHLTTSCKLEDLTDNISFYATPLSQMVGWGEQKWNLPKSASDAGVKIELRPFLAQFRANLSFPALKMLLSGL